MHGYVTPPPLWPCRFKQTALWLHENSCIRWRMGQKEQLQVFWLPTPLGELLEAACANCRGRNLCSLCRWTWQKKQSVSGDSPHPPLPAKHLVLFGHAVCKAGGLTACLYQPAKFCGTELARVGFSSLVEGTKQKWRSARLHTWSSRCLPLSASVVLRFLYFSYL